MIIRAQATNWTKATLPTFKLASAALELEGLLPEDEAVLLPETEPEPELLGEVALEEDAEAVGC